LVKRGEGLFEPRDVKLGRRGEGYVEVLDGLEDGETVVVSANFLIDSESNLKAAVAGFGQSGTGVKAAHAAEGKVVSAYPKTGSVIITHGPVASLQWGGMTMEFKVADPALFAAMNAGANIRFEFVEQPPGEWTVVRVAPLVEGREPAKAGAAHDSHQGH
jgi:Cu/Ag efflux protein CusF